LTKALQTTENEELLDLLAAALATISGFLSGGVQTRAVTLGTFTMHVCQSGLEEALGAQLWRSSFLLSRLMLARPEIVRGRDVLELGSGCGMCGMLAAKLGAKKVVLTDFMDAAIRNLEASLAANFSTGPTTSPELPRPDDRPRQETGRAGGGDCVRGGENVLVKFLDWSELPSRDEEQKSKTQHHGESDLSMTWAQFDCIIASDVIYEEDHAHSLPRSIAHFLAPGGCCFLTVPVRQKALLETFAENISVLGMYFATQEIDGSGFEDEGISGNIEYEGGFVHIEILWRE